ncbi:hypothetical protein GIW56_00285 [Pseudomonas gessardii]|uniref:Dermonecrotic toxin N-terminal domain-containing protein n=2 Tax=Pseudomonas gessardii TaxID=78544 RepID=A0ABS9EYH2_9PSED|nr:hypothetical protein [Pseudomonas gessardii]MCF4990530.1 hypothetical protein [Pseudomonas gessardii]MCF5082867.1 hypothetical protein [Pseudomonas gessardii]MCF5093235.1 hypothetical protein [Pseudomonas gessardii]MCF5105261.1 hypothetical protein [Pseudomonas gessardii]
MVRSMNTRSSQQPPQAPPASPLLPHRTLIKQQLPAWLIQAPSSLREAFRASMTASNQARHDLKALLDELQSPEDFARPLLRASLQSWFFGFITDENALLVREWKNHHLLGLIKTHAKTTRQTLLEAALQNFEAAEAEPGGMEDGTALHNMTNAGEVLTSASPAAFARLCRELDLGAKYLTHISSILEPSAGSARTAAQVLRIFRAQAQHAMGVALHIAYMRRQISPRQHLQLHSLQRSANHLDIKYSHLTLDNVVLPSVLVIEASLIDLPYILYVPDDPVAPLSPHRTWEDLQQHLAERLLNPAYQAFFKQLVPLQHQASLLSVTPAYTSTHELVRATAVYRATLEASVSLTPIQGDLFLAIARQRIAQIKSDASTLVVSTAEADMVSRQKRLQSWIEAGEFLLFFAASFIPIVGQALLVVSAAQVIGTVYEGFAAWSRGDSDEALNDLLDLVDTLAQAAVTAGAIKTAGFTANLVKVRVRNKGWRLWHSDLTPYRHPKPLPAHVSANKQGLFRHEQQHYLKLDDHVHSVQRSPDGTQWELSHPNDPDAYRPPLLSNGVGGWRQAHESPRDWDDLKLIKRLGPQAANIRQPDVEPILLLSGVDHSSLRQAHQDMEPPAPLLRDTVKHFDLEQEINDFNLARAEGKSVTAHSPLIQFHLLSRLPEWPADHTLKIVDGQQQILLSHGSGPTEIKISAARFKKGELLHAVEEQMAQASFNELLPTPSIDALTKTENLALRLQSEGMQQKQRLLALLSEPGERAVTPTEHNIRAIMPQLSKSHLEAMESTLTEQEKQRLQQEKSLTASQRWEAQQYIQTQQATRSQEALFLDGISDRHSVPLTLYNLEQLPSWPDALRIEIYAQRQDGPLLGRIGPAQASHRHVLIRLGEQYSSLDAQGSPQAPPSHLADALESTLAAPERRAILDASGTATLKQAIQKLSLSRLTQLPTIRAMPPLGTLAETAGRPLDPLFADPNPPAGLTLREDGTYQSPPQPDASYRYYIQDNHKYYPLRYDPLGWRLADARNRFRAYQPYLRQKPQAGWEIDPAKGTLLGGDEEALKLHEMESSDEFEPARSSSEYESAEEGVVTTRYTAQELTHMRTGQGYQFSQNYRRIYDRANNGRYPLRDEDGLPLRIRQIQSQSKSLTSEAIFDSRLIRPYFQWEGYEQVARLYEDNLEVTPFTAAHQKFAQEAALIGEATVITRRPIKRGAALGVYGGEILPLYIAMARQDPYLLPVKNIRPTTPHAYNTQPILSGDNVLSRINTIFEYDAGLPIRQARSGYNVEASQFRVEVETASGAREPMILTAFFASDHIPAGAELRWNYLYNEITIRRLFPRPESR